MRRKKGEGVQGWSGEVVLMRVVEGAEVGWWSAFVLVDGGDEESGLSGWGA
jgi:hypothetical protein